MRKIQCVIALFMCAWIGFVYADEAKIAYADVRFPDAQNSLYVGQNIEVGYTLTLLANAKLISTELVGLSNKNNIELRNKIQWTSIGEGKFSATALYRIKGKDVIIPPLLIKAQAEGGNTQEVLLNGASFQAITLSSNPNYANIIANTFEVVDYRAKEYDEANNIVIFQIEAKDTNLSAMKVPQYKMQGLEKSKILDGITYGIYYVVLDKSVKHLTFDYFNLSKKQFETISLPINLVNNVIDDGGDIKPRNTFLIFKNLFLGVSIGFFVLIWIVFRRIRKVSLGIIILLVLMLGYNVFFSATAGIAQVGASIGIIPSHNSTIMEVIKIPTKVAIIGEYGDYYKVMIESKVGWIRKEYVSKN